MRHVLENNNNNNNNNNNDATPNVFARPTDILETVYSSFDADINARLFAKRTCASREPRGRTRRVHALGHNHLTPYDAARDDDDDIRTFHFYEHAAFDGESWVSFIVDFSSSLGF